jgi:hypothetical protein
MALLLISVNVDKNDKICEWVEMQDHTHYPSPTYEFIYVENLSIPPVVISWQVWTDQAPTPCAWQARKRRQEEMQPLPTRPSRKDAEDSKNLGNPDDRFMKAMDQLQDFVSQVC